MVPRAQPMNAVRQRADKSGERAVDPSTRTVGGPGEGLVDLSPPTPAARRLRDRATRQRVLELLCPSLAQRLANASSSSRARSALTGPLGRGDAARRGTCRADACRKRALPQPGSAIVILSQCRAEHPHSHSTRRDDSHANALIHGPQGHACFSVRLASGALGRRALTMDMTSCDSSTRFTGRVRCQRRQLAGATPGPDLSTLRRQTRHSSSGPSFSEMRGAREQGLIVGDARSESVMGSRASSGNPEQCLQTLNNSCETPRNGIQMAGIRRLQYDLAMIDFRDSR